jgi:hypothetical protein
MQSNTQTISQSSTQIYTQVTRDNTKKQVLVVIPQITRVDQHINDTETITSYIHTTDKNPVQVDSSIYEIQKDIEDYYSTF